MLYEVITGDYVGAHGLWAKGLPCFREAYQIVSTVGYGNVKMRNYVEDAMISLADYAPTILELAKISTDRQFFGTSFRPFLEGEKPIEWRDTLFTQSNGNELYGIP